MRPSGRRPATSSASKRSPAWPRARASCARRNGWTASGPSPRTSGSRRRQPRPHDAPRVVPERLLPARWERRLARAELGRRGRRDARAPGTQRLRQDHRAEDGQRAAPAERGRSAGGRHAHRGVGRDPSQATDRLRDSGSGPVPTLHRRAERRPRTPPGRLARREDPRPRARPARAGRAAARAVRRPLPPRALRGPAPACRRRPRAGGRPADPALRRAVRGAGPGHPRRAAAPVPCAATGDRQDGDLRDARRPRGAAGGHAHRPAARRPAGCPGHAGRVSAGAGRGGPCVSRLPRHPGDSCMTLALWNEIVELTVEHVVLVATSIGIAVAVAIPAGILLTRRAPLQRWVMGFANIMQTVPSLALFGFLIPVPLLGGIGKHTAIVALVLYALLPVLRNTLAGILGVDRAVRESAIAMGMTGRQLLWEVELPLAARTILAGVRVATVTTIGTATIAAAIGGGGGGGLRFSAPGRPGRPASTRR